MRIPKYFPFAAVLVLVLGWMGVVASPAGALPTGTITTIVGEGFPGLGPWPGPGTSGALNAPHGVAYDSNNNSVFIADLANCEVVEDFLTSGTTSVVVNLAHACGGPSVAGTPALSALIGPPHGLTVDDAHNLLYITDPSNHGVEVVNLSTLQMMPFVALTPAAPICAPEGLGVDPNSGTLYVADYGCDVVWQIPFFEGPPTIVAGTFNSAGFSGNGGPATAAQLDGPSGVDYDPLTATLYIADGLNNEIRDVVGGNIFDYVGDPGKLSGCSPDGSTATSKINDPTAVRVDSAGDVFYDEAGNNIMREVVPGPGPLTTVAGTACPAPSGTPFPYSGDLATTVQLSSPHGLSVNPTTGDVYFSDTNNDVVDTVTGVAATSGPGTGTPEAPVALLLPLTALSIGGAVYLSVVRSRRRHMRVGVTVLPTAKELDESSGRGGPRIQ